MDPAADETLMAAEEPHHEDTRTAADHQRFISAGAHRAAMEPQPTLAGHRPTRLNRRLIVVLGALVVLVVVVVGALLISKPRASAPTPKVPQTTIWRAIMDQVKGPMSKDVALEAFAYAFGATIPGVRLPDGTNGTDGPQSGTGPLSWVQAHWPELTVEQRRAIAPYVTPQPGDVVLQNPTAIARPALALRAGGDLAVVGPDPTLVGRPENGPTDLTQQAYVDEIQGDLTRLGPHLGLPIIKLNSLQFLDADYTDSTLLATTGCPLLNPLGAVRICLPWAPFGTCNMIVPHNTWTKRPGIDPLMHTLLTHEAVHCYQLSIWASKDAEDRIPPWIAEGSALWLAADDTGNLESQVALQWGLWFGDPEQDLFTAGVPRQYEGFAYLALLKHLGRDLWAGMADAWRAAKASATDPSTAFIAVFNGDAADVRQDWAPSLLNTSNWGAHWVTNGFGLPYGLAVAQGPAIAATKSGTASSSSGRAAFVQTVNASDGEIVFVQTSDADAAAHEVTGGRSYLSFTSKRFCVQGDCICPPGTVQAGQHMADEDISLPFVLAVHGTTATWQSNVTSLSMDDLCKKLPTPAGPPCTTGCAASNGDPHLNTVNGHPYDFQAAGEFTLLRSPDASLEIQGRQEPWHDADDVSINTAIAARVGSHTVGVYLVADGLQARVDGAVRDATTAIDLGSGGRLVAFPNGYEIDFPDGTTLWALSTRGYGIAAQIRPSPVLVRSAVGLLGPVVPGGLDVPALPDGTRLPRTTDAHAAYTEVYTTLADAWRVTDASSLFTYDAGAATATFTKPGFPAEAAVTSLSALPPGQLAPALQACAAIADPGLRDECVFDVAVTGQTGFADVYVLTQTFQQQGVAGLSSTAPPESAAPETPVPTLGALPPAGIAQLIPLVDGVSGAALSPDGTLYLSIVLPDAHYAVVAADAQHGQIRMQVDASSPGGVAFAAGSAWVGETTPGGVCSIVRRDATSLAVQASITVPCTFNQPLFKALGQAIWFIDQTAVGTDGKGALLRMIDPATNQVSTTAAPLPYDGGSLVSSTGSTALIYGDIGKVSVFLATGATAFTPLATLQLPFDAVSRGAWTQDASTGTASLVGPSGVIATIPVGGIIVGADDRAVYVEGAPALDGSGMLWRYPADGSTPVWIAQGAAVGTANGNEALVYDDDAPLLVGDHAIVKIWLPVSRTDPLHKTLDVQWVALP